MAALEQDSWKEGFAAALAGQACRPAGQERHLAAHPLHHIGRSGIHSAALRSAQSTAGTLPAVLKALPTQRGKQRLCSHQPSEREPQPPTSHPFAKPMPCLQMDQILLAKVISFNTHNAGRRP